MRLNIEDLEIFYGHTQLTHTHTHIRTQSGRLSRDSFDEEIQMSHKNSFCISSLRLTETDHQKSALA